MSVHPLWVLLLALLCAAAADAKPNIVFVMTDDQGWYDVGYQGSGIQTPNIDEMSAEGVRLNSYYVQPICSPTRASFLTGRYQHHTGVHSYIKLKQPFGLPIDDDPTIGEMLQSAGYKTHLFGKWHLGIYKEEYTPLHRGFDNFYGLLIGASPHFSHMRDKRLDLWNNTEPDYNKNNYYSTHLFTDAAIQAINNHNSDEGPMFMFLSYQAPHDPLEVPKDYLKHYDEKGDWKDAKRRKYAGMVTCIDEGVGKVTQALKDQGMWENTVFIFSSDNGGVPKYGGHNYPLRGHKGTLWEGGMRAVAFVNSPLLENTGYTSDALMHVSDWYPTFAGLAGVSPAAAKMDGKDIWATISKNAPSPRHEIVHSINPNKKHGAPLADSGFDTSTRAAIRVGQYKLITGSPDSKDHGKSGWVLPPEMNPKPKKRKSKEKKNKNLWLFDVEADPEETRDLSGEMPGKVRELLGRLEEHSASLDVDPMPTNDPKGYPPKGQPWGPWIPERPKY